MPYQENGDRQRSSSAGIVRPQTYFSICSTVRAVGE